MLVELLGEVTLVSEDGRLHSVWVERELDAKLGVEVDEGVGRRALLFCCDSVLATDLSHHRDASIR